MSGRIGDTDHESLAPAISVVGLQVSACADELSQAARRLIDAEARVQEAEDRWHAAQDQLEQGAIKNAELLEMLRVAGEKQAEAEDRQHRVERDLEAAAARARELEEERRRAERELEAAVERARGLEEQGRVDGRGEGGADLTLVLDDERVALHESFAGEVRRPLASIMGLTLALKHSDPRSSEGVDMVRDLATNARKLDRLVGEMLDIERIASGEYELALRRTDLEALVRRVVDESHDLENREVIVELEHVAHEVDPSLTEQMIEMLLANAGRRTTPGNPVWVKLSERTDGVTISVEDTGPEIPSGLRSALFAATTKDGPAARQRPRGATGLTLLARFASLHAGRAWVEPRPGGGASFQIWFPSHRPPAGDDGSQPAGNVLPLRRGDEVEEAPSGGADVEARALALARALIAAEQEGVPMPQGLARTGDPLSDRLIAGAETDPRP